MIDVYTAAQESVDKIMNNGALESIQAEARLNGEGVDGDFRIARNQLIQAYADGQLTDEDALGVLAQGLMLWIKERDPEFDRLVECIKSIYYAFDRFNAGGQKRATFFEYLDKLFQRHKFTIGNEVLQEALNVMRSPRLEKPELEA